MMLLILHSFAFYNWTWCCHGIERQLKCYRKIHHMTYILLKSNFTCNGVSACPSKTQYYNLYTDWQHSQVPITFGIQQEADPHLRPPKKTNPIDMTPLRTLLLLHWCWFVTRLQSTEKQKLLGYIYMFMFV